MKIKYAVGAAALVLATSALAGGPEPAPANKQGFYINGNGGVNFLTQNYPYQSTGWNAGLALGYRFNQVRLEVAGSYLANNSNVQNLVLPLTSFGIPTGGGVVSFGQLQLADALLNGYYDFDFGSNFIPYVGAGVGYLHTSSTSTIAGNRANPANNARWSVGTDNMAFQGILGLDYQFNDHFRLGLSYHALGWTRDVRTTPGSNTGLLPNGTYNPTRFENLLNLGISYFF